MLGKDLHNELLIRLLVTMLAFVVDEHELQFLLRTSSQGVSGVTRYLFY